MANRIINGIPFDANAIIDQEGEVSYDYVLFAEDIAQWLSTYFGNGILVPKAALMTTQLQVSKASETQVSINKGNIVINGRTGFLKNPYNMNIDYANAGKQRIDRIVIELNTNETVNEFRPLVLKGVESEQNPQIPDITRDAYLGIYQMSLANVLVTADGVQTITDERNDSNLCGVSQVLIGVKPAVPVTGDSALNISYDNSYTGAEEKTVQDALDNLYNTKKKILLNGVDQQELKLSTKYQWVDDRDVLDLYNGTDQSSFPVFVEYKGETHAFLKNSVGHKKFVEGVWVDDVAQPDNKCKSSAYYADDEYIYSLRVRDLYKFDGTNWTLVYTIPTKSTYDETRYPEVATGDVSKGNGNLNFIVKNNKAYCSIKTEVYVSYNNIVFYYYLGYIDLLTLTWVNLPSAPNEDLIGYGKFGFIGSTIYMFCSNYSVYMLDEAESAWTKIVNSTVLSNWTSLAVLCVLDKIYVVSRVEMLCFDGSSFEKLYDTDQVQIPNLIIHDSVFHLFYIRNIPYKAPDSNNITNIQQAGVHKVLKKALYLED